MSRNVYSFKCSLCGEFNQSKRPRFCRNCGAQFFYNGDDPTPADTVAAWYKQADPDKPSQEEIQRQEIEAKFIDKNDKPDVDTEGQKKKKKEKKNMNDNKRYPWGWLIAIAIFVIAALILTPHLIDYIKAQTNLNQTIVQQLTDNSEKQEEKDLRVLEIELAQVKSQAELLTQQNQTLTKQNQTLTDQNQGLVTDIKNLATTQQIAVQGQALVSETTSPAKQTVVQQPKNQIINIINSSTPTAQVYGNEGINILTELDSVEYGYRWTSTARTYLYPAKTDPWQELTEDELSQVQNTWFLISFTVPQGYEATVFSHGFNTDENIQSQNGYLVMFTEGNYQISIRDWEIVFRPIADTKYRSLDLDRIFTEIKNGNKDIKGNLALTVVSNNLLEEVPHEIKNQIQLVDFTKMTIK